MTRLRLSPAKCRHVAIRAGSCATCMVPACARLPCNPPLHMVRPRAITSATHFLPAAIQRCSVARRHFIEEIVINKAWTRGIRIISFLIFHPIFFFILSFILAQWLIISRVSRVCEVHSSSCIQTFQPSVRVCQARVAHPFQGVHNVWRNVSEQGGATIWACLSCCANGHVSHAGRGWLGAAWAVEQPAADEEEEVPVVQGQALVGQLQASQAAPGHQLLQDLQQCTATTHSYPLKLAISVQPQHIATLWSWP